MCLTLKRLEGLTSEFCERVSGNSSRICRDADHRHRPYRSGHMAGAPIRRKKGMTSSSPFASKDTIALNGVSELVTDRNSDFGVVASRYFMLERAHTNRLLPKREPV